MKGDKLLPYNFTTHDILNVRNVLSTKIFFYEAGSNFVYPSYVDEISCIEFNFNINHFKANKKTTIHHPNFLKGCFKSYIFFTMKPYGN